MSYLLYLLGGLVLFLIALLATITLHEWGHYVAARAVGVKVLRVRIGFGKPLLTFGGSNGRTLWSVAQFIVGGITVLLDERHGSIERIDQRYAFNHQSLWRRIIIILGGSIANLLVPVLVIAWFLAEGIVDATPVIREPYAFTAASNAGLREGDRVVSVNNILVSSWWHFEEEIAKRISKSEALSIVLENRQGKHVRVFVPPTSFKELATKKQHAAKNLGFTKIRGDTDPTSGRVVSGSPAAIAGLRPGDYVLELDGHPINAWSEIAKIVELYSGHTLKVHFYRDGQIMNSTVTPRQVDYGLVKIGTLGIFPLHAMSAPVSNYAQRGMPGLEALRGAFLYTIGVIQSACENIYRIISSNDPTTFFSRSPVIAAESISDAMHNGPLGAIALLCALSVCLGWFNLLPIPQLDGTELLSTILAWIRQKNRGF